MPRLTVFFRPIQHPHSLAPSPAPSPLPGPTEIDEHHRLAPQLDAFYYSEASSSETSDVEDSDTNSESAATMAQSPPRKRMYVDKRLPAVCPLSRRELREQKLAAENMEIEKCIKELETRLRLWRVRETVNI
jgi:hypothetical protein